MPAVVSKEFIKGDQLFTMRAEPGPENHVAKNRHVHRKSFRRRLLVRFHQRCAEGLVADLGLPGEERILIKHLRAAIWFAGDAQTAALFVNPFIEAPGQTAPGTILKIFYEKLIKAR